MVSSRKRGREDPEAIEAQPQPPKEKSLIDRLRSTWEFANLAQWIFFFGKVVKIDEDIGIEELEIECLKPYSTVLPDIGLALLKFVSSHRGLTPELFDEYTRRQYVAKAPLRNPFGIDEEPAKFTEFDVFMKLRVLQQLTQWVLFNPDRIREKMEEQKDTEQTGWRIEAFGWDSDDRTYFLLDDNRLYRRTDPPPPPEPKPKPKKNTKKTKAALRASKRRKLSETAESEVEPAQETEDAENAIIEKDDDSFGGMIWECVAITLDEYNSVIASMERSRDPNEKVLRKRIIDQVLPQLEKAEESRKRKAAQKERELLNLEKLATAKRSSRIRGRVEQQKHEEDIREAERKKAADLAMAKKEQEKWMKLEKERESRMITREQRLKEREVRRILHEEELANLSEDGKKIETGEGRLSERHLKAEMERKKQEIEALTEDEDWIFDCICGAYGQIDDGTHSIACEKCNIWQHSKCVGVSEVDAERDDFEFICTTCIRRAEDAKRAKTQPPIKIKLSRPGSSSSSALPKQSGSPSVLSPSASNSALNFQAPAPKQEQLPTKVHESPSQQPKKLPQLSSWQTAPRPSPKKPAQGQQTHYQPSIGPQQSNGYSAKPMASAATSSTSSSGQPIHFNSSPTNGTISTPQQSFSQPMSAHVFSSPHPQSPTNLPPPSQPKTYHFVNGNTQYNQSGKPSFISPYSTSEHQVQAPPGHATSQGYGVPRPGSSDGSHRRGSLSMPSPLAGPPILASGIQTPAPAYPPNSRPTASFATTNPSISSVAEASSSLPPPLTGMSPTKYSPPRPVTSNGNNGFATPSMLPPVASLPPSSPIQDLTPPVKQALDGTWSRPNGVGQGSSS